MVKIRDLPEEVLVLIFSYLKLRERKTAARVSRQWHRLAFTDRPMRTIVLHVVDYLNQKERKILLKSNRCYRNLTLEWTEASSVPFLLEVLDKFGTELHSLKLATYVVTPPILVRFLLKAPSLRQLMVEGSVCNEDCDMVLPVFKGIRALEMTQRGFESELCDVIPALFPNLVSLDLVGAEDAAIDLIGFYGKQLKFLHVLLEFSQFQRFSNLNCLTGLERMHVFWPQPSDFRQVFSVFEQMDAIQSASLTGPVNEATFDLICRRWKNITSLCVNVQSLKAASFRNIAAFKKLKVLKLQGSIRDSNFLKDVQLPTVTHLVLDGISTNCGFYNHMSTFVPNVWMLKIYDHTFENAQLRLITKTMTSLRVLSLDYCYQIKDEGFQLLNNLTNLLELRCWSISISENAFIRFPKCPNLRTFSVGGSGWVPYITNKTVLDIPKAFPHLRELHVVDCFKVDEDTIYTLQESMRKCAVVRLEKPELDREVEAVWGWNHCDK
ncbi:uncharacterized protein LOC115269092 isoform X1 [Aedes albopictus]|uniref:F-box domain-containing protein n=1 Tax=Aedes albopictus TaxID=7160 RepID=A0ABM1ZN81_AEDAL|nr:uncharacterized protein LOC115269092 isoform X1 [Aedes albopictus]